MSGTPYDEYVSYSDHKSRRQLSTSRHAGPSADSSYYGNASSYNPDTEHVELSQSQRDRELSMFIDQEPGQPKAHSSPELEDDYSDAPKESLVQNAARLSGTQRNSGVPYEDLGEAIRQLHAFVADYIRCADRVFRSPSSFSPNATGEVHE
jgi:hypothetical protein